MRVSHGNFLEYVTLRCGNTQVSGTWLPMCPNPVFKLPKKPGLHTQAPSSVHRSKRPGAVQSLGQRACWQASPVKLASQTHVPCSHDPWNEQKFGHSFVAQSSPWYPG